MPTVLTLRLLDEHLQLYRAKLENISTVDRRMYDVRRKNAVYNPALATYGHC